VWPSTLSRAEHERVAPLLYVALRDRDAPAAAVTRLRAAWVAAQRQHLLAGVQLRDVVRALGDAGVPAIVLKGPSLAADYYQDPALRPFTDLDLLVRHDHRARAIDVLTTLGYAHASPGRSLPYELEHAPAANFAPPRGALLLPIDLHWDCVIHPGGRRATDIAADEIWSRAQATPAWGATAWTLAPEDLVVYLAAHLAIHHVLTGILWQLDLALVLRRQGATLDWQAVSERAERWRAGAAVYFALRVVTESFGVAVPGAVMRRLWPGHVRVAIVEALRDTGSDRVRRLEHLVALVMMDRAADVARTLSSGVAPPPRWLRRRYGARSVLAAYATHYGRLAGIVARAFKPVG
jgi:hypothetical protein